MKKDLLFMCCLVFLSSPSTAQAVRGGEIVQSEDPVMKATAGLVPVCTAVVIAPDLALTAAHCYKIQGESEFVYFGALLKQPAEKRKILNFKTHEDYVHRILKNDIALIRFEGGVPEGYRIVPIATADEVAAATAFVGAGYGLDERRMAGQLKKATLPLAVDDFFRNEDPTRITLAMSPEAGLCQGDSGGPIFIRTTEGLKVGALLSFVDRRCSAYAVGTKIFPFEEWIRKAAEELRK